ncbi:Alpha-galactosidase [Orbilia brochopaga]|nr:Alpha-galactosidase [Drechslerella brochopaga]
MKTSQSILALTAAASPALAAKQLLATPPMGFNNWARFECALNQTLFTDTADAMAANGLLAAGYDRVNIDDCWPLHDRAADGQLQWNATLFPDGMPWLGSYLKERGFHFGIYSDAGTYTCGGYPGSLGYEEIDAATFANWGVDYLKLDGCYVSPFTTGKYEEIYSHWHKVIAGMEKPLIFSESAPAYFCEDKNGNYKNWYNVMNWVPQYGELARHSYDIPVFGDRTAWRGVTTNYDENVLLARYQKPGFFNDPDFLIADHPKLTLTEKKSQFALWCSFSAPLIISAWIPALDIGMLEALKNERLIAINQDPLALQATLVSRNGEWDVLSKSLSNGDRVLTIFNRQAQDDKLFVPFERAGYPVDPAGGQKYNVTDLWTGNSDTSVTKGITADVPSHGVQVYRISPLSGSGSDAVVPTGMIFNTASHKCLTADISGAAVYLTGCAASDSQVWRVKSDGSISSLASPDNCLRINLNGGAVVGLKACGDTSVEEQQWQYSSTGYILSSGIEGSCLSAGDNDSVVVLKCGADANKQVFEMPSGSLRS